MYVCMGGISEIVYSAHTYMDCDEVNGEFEETSL